MLPVAPNRGLISGSQWRGAGHHDAAYTLEITPSKAGVLEETIQELSKVVDIHARDKRRFKRRWKSRAVFDSLPIRTRLTDEEVAPLHGPALPLSGRGHQGAAVSQRTRWARWPATPLATSAHQPKEKERIEDSEEEANYRGTEYIGKLGIEQSFEAQLHGITGVEQMETSAGGRAVRRLNSFPATPGHTVALSLDIKLQSSLKTCMAIAGVRWVAIDPRNGEVLALVSKPTSIPTCSSRGLTKKTGARSTSPLTNRCSTGRCAAPIRRARPTSCSWGWRRWRRASDTAGTIIHDGGSWTFGGHTFRSHGDHGLGAVDLYRSIVQSSNVYLLPVANDMGVSMPCTTS